MASTNTEPMDVVNPPSTTTQPSLPIPIIINTDVTMEETTPQPSPISTIADLAPTLAPALVPALPVTVPHTPAFRTTSDLSEIGKEVALMPRLKSVRAVTAQLEHLRRVVTEEYSWMVPLNYFYTLIKSFSYQRLLLD